MKADFLVSYGLSMNAEGGYSNDPRDPGGETYKGIARVFNPTWAGWELIDELKKSSHFATSPVEVINRILGNSQTLQVQVQDFYRKDLWEYFGLSDIPQEVADEIFDMAMNQGKPLTAMRIQLVLNESNDEAKLWPDIPVDGKFGPVTKSTLVTGCTKRASIVLKGIRGERYIRYRVLVAGLPEIRALYDSIPMLKIVVEGNERLRTIVNGNPTKEHYFGGWINRI